MEQITGEKLIINCITCDKEIQRRPSDINKNNFCSRECYNKWMEKYQIKDKNPNWRGGVSFHNCKVCEKEYVSGIKGTKYCSIKCGSIGRKTQVLKVCENCGKEFETFKSLDKRIKCCSNKCRFDLVLKQHIKHIVCKGCGIEFLPPMRQIKKQRYTLKVLFHSAECLTEWRKKRYVKEKNPRWLGGTIRYRGPDWDVQRKKAARRDNLTCQSCYAIPEILHIHHIIPYRISKDNRLENLISLCSVCHTTQDNDFRRFNQPSLRIKNWLKEKGCLKKVSEIWER